MKSSALLFLSCFVFTDASFFGLSSKKTAAPAPGGSPSDSASSLNIDPSQFHLDPNENSAVTKSADGEDYIFNDVPPPSSIFLESQIVEGPARRDLPGLLFRMKPEAVTNFKSLAYGMIFGDNRWEKLIAGLLGDELNIPVQYGSIEGTISVSKIQVNHVAKPKEELLDFKDKKLNIAMKGIDSDVEFDFVLKSKTNLLYFWPASFSGHVKVVAKNVGFSASLIPFFTLVNDEKTGKESKVFVVNIDDAKLDILDGTDIILSKNIVLSMTTPLIKFFKWFTGKYITGWIQKAVVDYMKSTIPNICKDYGYSIIGSSFKATDDFLKQIYDVDIDLEHNFSFEKQKIKLLDNNFILSSDIILNLKKSIGLHDGIV